MMPAPGAQKRTGSQHGGGFAQSVAFSAARGALLIGVAVIIGIVLLQVVDDGTGPPIGDRGGGNGKAAAATSTTKPSSSSSTSTTAGGGTSGTKQPGEITVQVLNGSGVARAAATLAQKLQAGGYQAAGTNDTASQQGTVVYCASGLDKEGAALAAAVGSDPPARAEALPMPLPENADPSAACIVVVGA